MLTRTLTLVASWLLASTALAAPGESSFTPTSLLVPLLAIRLEGSNGEGADLYRCPNAGSTHDMNDAGVDLDDAGAPVSAADACLVDMADNAALAALFAHAIDIQPGTYDHVGIYSCTPGAQSYVSYVKGSVELLGHTHFTTNGSEVLTRQLAHQGYTRIEYGGCGAGVPLPAPVTVAADDEITINAFFTLKNLAWATMSSFGPGGCTFNAAHNQDVCTGYPIPVTYVGSTSPTLDTFFITENQSDTTAAQAGGQLLLLSGPEGHVFGGFSRRFYSATSIEPSVNYDTPIKSVKDNAPDPGYTITTFGGGSNVSGPVEFYIRFPAFVPQTHNGMLERANGLPTVAYRAVLQP